MSSHFPEIFVDFHSDEEMPDEYEDFYNQCDRLYNRVANYPVTPEYQCKKDSRYWLYKNRDRQRKTQIPDAELTYEQVYSVVGINGRRFKKDSRVWFHKTSEKAAKLKQLEQAVRLKHLEKNSNCKMTPSYHDRNDAGIDENSLTAMSKIAICSSPWCQGKERCTKRCQDTEIQDTALTCGCNRNKKRRKTSHCSVPASPVHYNEFGFAIVSKSLDRGIGFTDCLNKMHGDMHVHETDSTESLNSKDTQRSWKQEKFPYRWREFKIVSSASSCSDGDTEKHTPVSSGGSLNLVSGFSDHSESASDVTSRGECPHVKYTPKRKVSVYNIVNEDFYDFYSGSVESPRMKVVDDDNEQDMDETF